MKKEQLTEASEDMYQLLYLQWGEQDPNHLIEVPNEMVYFPNEAVYFHCEHGEIRLLPDLEKAVVDKILERRDSRWFNTVSICLQAIMAWVFAIDLTIHMNSHHTDLRTLIDPASTVPFCCMWLFLIYGVIGILGSYTMQELYYTLQHNRIVGKLNKNLRRALSIDTRKPSWYENIFEPNLKNNKNDNNCKPNNKLFGHL